MKAESCNIIHFADGRHYVLLDADHGDFERGMLETGFRRGSALCILVEDRWFALAEWCPAEGIPRWTLAEYEASLLRDEADILALPEALRNRTFPNYEPVAARRARRDQEDADMQARIEAKAADEKERRDAATAAREAEIEAAAQRLLAARGGA